MSGGEKKKQEPLYHMPGHGRDCECKQCIQRAKNRRAANTVGIGKHASPVGKCILCNTPAYAGGYAQYARPDILLWAWNYSVAKCEWAVETREGNLPSMCPRCRRRTCQPSDAQPVEEQASTQRITTKLGE